MIRSQAIILVAFSGVVWSSTSARGDVVRILDADNQALQARIDLIQGARRELCLSYFCIGKDDVALGTLALVRDAAVRGVRVRVLIDAVSAKVPAPILAVLVRDGIEIREYHPIRIDRPSWTLRRLHDKLLLVDGHQFITGGRNIEARYFGLAPENYLDRDVYVRGPVAGEAQRYFDEIWNSDDVAPVNPVVVSVAPLGRLAGRARAGDAREQTITLAARKLEQTRMALGERPTVQLVSFNDWSAGQFDVAGARFLCDPLDGRRRDNDLTDSLLAAFAAARHSIWIESPYLYLTPPFFNALEAACQRGVKVRIITNSLATTDQMLAQAGYESQRPSMQRAGMELWEYKGPRCLHSKSFLVDDRVAIIGSFNLDPRSERRDTQVAVLVDNPRIGAALLASLERDAANSQPAATGPVQLPAFDPNISPDRRILFGVSRLLAPLIEGEL